MNKGSNTPSARRFRAAACVVMALVFMSGHTRVLADSDHESSKPADRNRAKTSPKRQKIDIKKMSMEEILALANDSLNGTEATPRDVGRAKWLFGEAAARGSIDAMYMRAALLLNGEVQRPNPRGALEQFEILANKHNHAPSAEAAGRMHLSGEAHGKNYFQASKYLTMAVEQGQISAKEPLASVYDTGGPNFGYDRVTAGRLYQEAADDGALSPAGLCRLGELRRDGIWVDRDLEAADELFRRAAEAGYTPAVARRARLMLASDAPEAATQALPLLIQAAEAKDPDGMTELGRALLFGRGIDRDLTRAQQLLNDAAAAGSGFAMETLSDMYAVGFGCTKAPDLSAKFMQAAVEAEWAPAMVRLGLKKLEQSRFTPGNAQAFEAKIFLQAEASALFDRATWADNLHGMSLLADVLWSGEGRTRDRTRAAEWCTRAAHAGFLPAMNRIGYAYLTGDGVRQSRTHAWTWFHRAAQKGFAEAMANLGGMVERGQAEDFEDENTAIYWYGRSADAGNTNAMVWVANAYLEGRGVEQNTDEGLGWLRRGVEAGSPVAMRTLGQLMLEGDAAEQSDQPAIDLITKAAELKDGPAMYHLGMMRLNGMHVDQNSAEARRWFERAEYAGEGRAALARGAMFLQEAREGDGWSTLGDLDEFDLGMAVSCFRNAERLGVTLPAEYRQIAVDVEAKALARSRYFDMNNVWSSTAGDLNRAAADRAYDAQAAMRDFQSQTAAYLGSQGLMWR